MHECSISEKGGARFIQAMEINTTLQGLCLHGNKNMKESTWTYAMSLSQTKRTCHRTQIPHFPSRIQKSSVEKGHGMESMKKQTEEKDKVIERMKKSMEEKDRTVEQMKKMIREKERKEEFLKKKIEEKDRLIEDMDIPIQHDGCLMAQNTETIDEKERAMKSMEKEIQAKDSIVKSMEKEIQAKYDIMRSMEKEIERKDHMIKGIKESMRLKNAKIAHLEIQCDTNAVQVAHEASLREHETKRRKLIDEHEGGLVPFISSSSLSASASPCLGAADVAKGFLCFFGHAKVRMRMLNAEERLSGIQKWFISSQRCPFVPRFLGVVKKEDIPRIDGIEHFLPHLEPDVDGVGIIDAATIGTMTLHDALHHRHDRTATDEEGNFLDLTSRNVIFSILADIANVLTFLHHELEIVHGSVSSHSTVLRFSREEGRFVAQLSDVGLWSRSMLNDDRIRWVAPEVIASGGSAEPSFSSDVWSFGMLVEEMITGKVPFSSKDMPSLVGIGIFTRKFETHPRLFDPSECEELIEACRLEDQNDRPSMIPILEFLRAVVASF
eukprot:TRINITY_DN595_c0_g1_i3.p1 TRINITY_DN595_c0_g1~~TRINITY_DN595_c0_g1_i3.p1  ORF type:complete len:578 (+),score=169.89 TRINITY_DN595_c0_g1_i3:81-1736(+)